MYGMTAHSCIFPLAYVILLLFANIFICFSSAALYCALLCWAVLYSVLLCSACVVLCSVVFLLVLCSAVVCLCCDVLCCFGRAAVGEAMRVRTGRASAWLCNATSRQRSSFGAHTCTTLTAPTHWSRLLPHLLPLLLRLPRSHIPLCCGWLQMTLGWYKSCARSVLPTPPTTTWPPPLTRHLMKAAVPVSVPKSIPAPSADAGAGAGASSWLVQAIDFDRAAVAGDPAEHLLHGFGGSKLQVGRWPYWIENRVRSGGADAYLVQLTAFNRPAAAGQL